MTSITPMPSPNFDSRSGADITMLVLHYTGMRSGQEAIARLRDPAAKVSAHYVIEEDGTVFRLVEEEKRAWHAGVSSWRGNRFVNAHSIGIEIVNPGHEFGYRAFPEVQMRSVIGLCQGILTRHPIPARNVVAHSDVAPLRKEDPGELFDWAWLACEGVGLWPEKDSGGARGQEAEPALSAVPWDFQEKIPGTNTTMGATGDAVLAMQSKLNTFGYEIHPDGIFGEQTASCIVAFQRHFRPASLSGEWDGQCEGILSALLGMLS